MSFYNNRLFLDFVTYHLLFMIVMHITGHIFICLVARLHDLLMHFLRLFCGCIGTRSFFLMKYPENNVKFSPNGSLLKG